MGRNTATTSRLISAPPEIIWKALQDLRQWPLWFPDMRPRSGYWASGQQIVVVFDKPWNKTQWLKVIEFTPLSRLRYRVCNRWGWAVNEHRWTLSVMPNQSTRVTWEQAKWAPEWNVVTAVSSDGEGPPSTASKVLEALDLQVQKLLPPAPRRAWSRIKDG